jgi:hypothetical protein
MLLEMAKRQRWVGKTQGLWKAVQGLSVVAALTLPVLARLNAEDIPGAKADSSAISWTAPAAASVHMTSRVLQLPAPDELARPDGLRVAVEARQLRFEHLSGAVRAASDNRAPASQRNGAWRLKELRRIHSGAAAWDAVQIVREKGAHEESSIFVELDEGANLFEAVFWDPSTGRTSSYPVRVEHVRNSI